MSGPRVLICHPGPSFSVADVHDGWAAGLTDCGAQVVSLNLNDRLEFYESAALSRDGEPYAPAFTAEQAIAHACKGIESACYEWWPDIVVIVSGFYVPRQTYELMRARGHQVVLLHTESPYEDDRQMMRAPWATVNILNDPTNLEAFREINPATHYLPHAYRPERHHPGGTPEHDFAFVGTGYPSRIEYLEAVDWSHIDAVLAGNWEALDEGSPLRPFVAHEFDECLPNDQTAELYRSAAVGLNLYRKETSGASTADGWAMGPREVELAACGAFYLTEERGENRDVLPMVPTVSGPDEFSEALRWWLNHPAERERVATAARAAIADRTFTNHARWLLQLLGH